MNSDDSWIDWDSGPAARPYTVTGGRTRPRGDTYFGLIDVIFATGAQPGSTFSAGPEHWRILDLCRRPVTVADVASDVGFPLGVVRVLLSDLVCEGLLAVLKPTPRERVTDVRLLREVLEGLRAL
jgi:hypothetical protein